MSLLLVATLARAGGGDDHDHGPPIASATYTVVTADSVSVSAASTTFEAVLRAPRAAPGVATDVSLLLADYATSAPVEGATGSLTLSGPGSAQAELGAAGSPGAYHGALTLPAYGDYAGALVVTAPGASDLLAVSGLHYDPPAVTSGEGMGAGTVALAGAGLLALLGVVAVVFLGLGFLLGRRRAAAAVATLLALGVGLSSRRVSAHGGEDHGEASTAPTAPAGAALALPMDSQFLVGLRTAVLARDAFVDRVPALGRFVARPGEAATLGAPVDGVVVAPPRGFPHPGQVVKAGDTLAFLQEVPGTADRAAIAQERGGAATRVAEAKSALALAQRDAASLDVLADAISERERTARRNAVEVARVTLQEAERALAALSGGATVAIRAPVDGRVGAVNARPGDQVAAGTTLFRIVDPRGGGLWMEAHVPERLALGLVAGASALVTPSALPGHTLEAVVLDAGQEADPATGMVTVTLAVQAGDLGLRLGMGATAWIGRGAPRDALVVPAAAVVDSNGARLAFVKTGPESFEARDLRLGGRAGGAWEVLGGLAPGERVVVDGTYTLRSIAGR
ncbi:MAG: efflux RND transporter periplasmic adaptor subunit [Myxococcota bacterium]